MITFQALVTSFLEGLKVEILITTYVNRKEFGFYQTAQPMEDNQRVVTGSILGLTHDDFGYEGIQYNLIVMVEGELEIMRNMYPDLNMSIST